MITTYSSIDYGENIEVIALNADSNILFYSIKL